ncbi:hypothetical protein EGT07_13475 [Herbaspirillum sp. HC18]|nr:hypothetical protein EGT07_13475 [Herbaspirillum sp. HC18]
MLLIAGTIFSMVFAWATGTLFARPGLDRKSPALHLKRSAGGLIGFASVAVFLSFLVATCVFWQAQQENEVMRKMGRATPEIASKCAEIASLERKLFQSDEQFVLAQCLIQYDKQYAAMSGMGEKNTR